MTRFTATRFLLFLEEIINPREASALSYETCLKQQSDIICVWFKKRATLRCPARTRRVSAPYYNLNGDEGLSLSALRAEACSDVETGEHSPTSLMANILPIPGS